MPCSSQNVTACPTDKLWLFALPGPETWKKIFLPPLSGSIKPKPFFLRREVSFTTPERVTLAAAGTPQAAPPLDDSSLISDCLFECRPAPGCPAYAAQVRLSRRRHLCGAHTVKVSRFQFQFFTLSTLKIATDKKSGGRLCLRATISKSLLRKNVFDVLSIQGM